MQETLSVSSILNFAKCPYSFFLYKTKERQEETKPLANGKAFHKLVELILLGYDFKDAFIEIIENSPPYINALEIKNFYEIYKPELEKIKGEGIEAVEKSFELEVDGVVVKGVIDIITKNRRLIELKTTKKTIDEPLPHHLFQVSVYRLLDDADTYELHYVSENHFLKYVVKPFPISFVMNILKEVKVYIETNKYPPLGLLRGHCKFCLYKNFCLHYSKIVGGGSHATD